MDKKKQPAWIVVSGGKKHCWSQMKHFHNVCFPHIEYMFLSAKIWNWSCSLVLSCFTAECILHSSPNLRYRLNKTNVCRSACFYAGRRSPKQALSWSGAWWKRPMKPHMPEGSSFRAGEPDKQLVKMYACGSIKRLHCFLSVYKTDFKILLTLKIQTKCTCVTTDFLFVSIHCTVLVNPIATLAADMMMGERFTVCANNHMTVTAVISPF